MSIVFGYELDDDGTGHVITHRPATYHVELLQNGYAHVHHRPSGLTGLVDPGRGVIHSGVGRLPGCLLTEIRSRWGGQ